MDEIRSHIDALKSKAKELEEGKIKPFQKKVVEHYFDSMHEAFEFMTLALKETMHDNCVDKDELMSIYSELENFYKERLDFQRSMSNLNFS